MLLRYSKIMAVAAIALFASLVAYGNLTDYNTNFMFVTHVLKMDTVFADSVLRSRAIDIVWVHHAAYWTIIGVEALVAIMCWMGVVRMLSARFSERYVFQRAKQWAIAGLILGFLLWQVGFMTVGGEWFGMWMSSEWNGIESAFRFVVVILLVLIFLVMPEATDTTDVHADRD